MRRLLFSLLVLGVGVCGAGAPAWAARDASFLAPSAAQTSGTMRAGDGAIGIEPKADIDLGETAINVGKRTTLFFVNQTNLPVGIVGITANGDTNVAAEIVADDCTKQGSIAASSRCSVTVEVTPKGSGPWTAEVLMTHNAAGRLARAKLTGKTSGSTEKKESGLSLSTKEIKPVDFGNVDVGTGKAVRSALMVNDSNEPITVLSIEVIAAENGLQRLEQGCAPDMDLKPGESCPVTLIWKPQEGGAVSTDLIIRHTGRLGFAVIPIRGLAKEAKGDGPSGGNAQKGAASGKEAMGSPSGVPLSPTAEEMEKMLAGKVPALSGEELPDQDHPGKAGKAKASKDSEAEAGEGLHLIGTIGSRALFYKPDGETVVVGVGEEIELGEDVKAKLLNVAPKQAEVTIGGKKKTLTLESVSSLTSKAAKARKEKETSSAKSKSQRKSGASSKDKG